jgi:tetratricopeptide (TPR) repeat protein
MKCGWTVSIIRRGGLLPIVSALVLSLVHSEPSLAQTAQAYREQADALARSKSWEEAIAAYRKVLELDPNDGLTQYDLAFAQKYKGDTKQAVEEFEAAIRLKPVWAEAHFGLGAALY